MHALHTAMYVSLVGLVHRLDVAYVIHRERVMARSTLNSLGQSDYISIHNMPNW